MERLRIILLFCVLVSVSCSRDLDSEVISHSLDDQLIIKSGIVYGECMGYCAAEITVTRTLSTFKRISNNGQKIQTCVWPTQPETWQRLLTQLDTHQLAQLPLQIECPTCGNKGTEWLEIQHSGKFFQTNFNSVDTIPELASLLQQVHQIYRQGQLKASN